MLLISIYSFIMNYVRPVIRVKQVHTERMFRATAHSHSACGHMQQPALFHITAFA